MPTADLRESIDARPLGVMFKEPPAEVVSRSTISIADLGLRREGSGFRDRENAIQPKDITVFQRDIVVMEQDETGPRQVTKQVMVTQFQWMGNTYNMIPVENGASSRTYLQKYDREARAFVEASPEEYEALVDRGAIFDDDVISFLNRLDPGLKLAAGVVIGVSMIAWFIHINRHKLFTRREFLWWFGALLLGGVGLGTLAGCGGTPTQGPQGRTPQALPSPEVTPAPTPMEVDRFLEAVREPLPGEPPFMTTEINDFLRAVELSKSDELHVIAFDHSPDIHHAILFEGFEDFPNAVDVQVMIDNVLKKDGTKYAVYRLRLSRRLLEDPVLARIALVHDFQHIAQAAALLRNFDRQYPIFDQPDIYGPPLIQTLRDTRVAREAEAYAVELYLLNLGVAPCEKFSPCVTLGETWRQVLGTYDFQLGSDGFPLNIFEAPDWDVFVQKVLEHPEFWDY